MSPECQELLQSLERASARLAAFAHDDWNQLDQALAERSRAIEAMGAWIAGEQTSSRPLNPELACRLMKDLENGAAFLVRMAIHREATRADLQCLGRELQVLHSLSFAAPRKTSVIDCQG